MFPTEYKRALAEQAAEDQEKEMSPPTPMSKSPVPPEEEKDIDVLEGEELYSEDIMQDTPSNTMQAVGHHYAVQIKIKCWKMNKKKKKLRAKKEKKR